VLRTGLAYVVHRETGEVTAVSIDDYIKLRLWENHAIYLLLVNALAASVEIVNARRRMS